MSITDELREYAHDCCARIDDDIHAIADRIDAEHEAWRRGCVFYEPERNYCKVHDEGDMAELGYVRLPVDADGVPWHIGDRTESGQTIQAIGLNKHGWHFVGTVNDIDPSIHHHYKPPTVEDVLSEMLDAWGELPSNATNEAIIAEYAAKLRLAEEDA